MPKQKSKSISNTTQELALMRMNIQALKERLCLDLDAMVDRLDRLLPPENATRYQKYKNYTKEDWHKFLNL